MANRDTDELIIRPVRMDDAALLFQLVDRDRPRLSTYFPLTTGKTRSLRSTMAYVDDLIAQAGREEAICHLVFTEEGDHPIGAVFLKSFDRHVGKCEVAYFVSGTHENRGVATGALTWAVDDAFRNRRLNKVYLRVDPGNRASIRVAEKAGFQQEGLLRQDFRTEDGRLLDVLIFGKLKEPTDP